MAETLQIPLQLCFNISYEVSIRRVGVLPSGNQTFLGYEDSIPASVTLCLPDIDLSNNEHRVSEELSLVFSGIGIDSSFHQRLVSHVAGELRKHINGALIEKREFLFDVQLLLKKIHYMVYDEIEIIDIKSSLEGVEVSCELNQSDRVEIEPGFESVSENYEFGSVEVESIGEIEDTNYEEEEVVNGVEYEYGNCGMIPAAVESVEMLKEVKVKEEEKGNMCSVCLEGLEEFALALPCEHTFHAKCIEGWLSMSHFCPLCRFEMPTEV